MVADAHREHAPVLGAQALDALDLERDGCVVDATFGRGGHTQRILDRLGPEGQVLAMDRDPQAIAAGQQAFSGEERLHLWQGAFSRLGEAVAEMGWAGVDGILVDLGVSSPQLDEAERGFSFRKAGPLDMRMDPASGMSARDWLSGVDAAELERVIREYGGERYARRVARAILAARSAEGLESTLELAEVVREAIPGRGEPGKDKATRTFQALRMAVNAEPDELEAVLTAAVEALRPGGRLVVIAFHSVEDRIVKQRIRHEAAACVCPPELPVCRCDKTARLESVGKPMRPGEAESRANTRARSAIARVARRRSL